MVGGARGMGGTSGEWGWERWPVVGGTGGVASGGWG